MSKLLDGAPHMAVTKEALDSVLTGIIEFGNAELRSMKQEDLEQRWFFRWDDTASLEWNIYQFHDMLDLYGSFCRRWEQMHNGSVCIVERVRDTYLMPKIREFAARMRDPSNT
ncbi:MAG: hypothetical protein ACK40R_08780 [Thermomonas sp.]